MPPTTTEQKGGLPRAPADGEEPAQQGLLSGDLSGSKRKAPEKQKRFKIVGQMVMAMQRFQASLNPTYTYGKRTSSTSGSLERKAPDTSDAAVTSGEPVRTSSPRPADLRRTSTTGGHTAVYPDRGHKADYLFRPLPDVPPTAAVASSSDKVD